MRAMFDRCTEHGNDMTVAQFVLLFLSHTIFREASMFDRCTEHGNDLMVAQFVLLFLSRTIISEASMKMDIWPQLFKRWKKLSTG